MTPPLPATHPDAAVEPDRHQLALVHHDLLDGAGMARLAPLAADLHLDQAALPQQHVAPVAPRQHLAVGQLHVPLDVRDLRLSELAQLSLQLQPGERVRHLPKPAAALRQLSLSTLQQGAGAGFMKRRRQS